jgi:aromatic ring-opening dioxygenase LigB subunit
LTLAGSELAGSGSIRFLGRSKAVLKTKPIGYSNAGSLFDDIVVEGLQNRWSWRFTRGDNRQINLQITRSRVLVVITDFL